VKQFLELVLVFLARDLRARYRNSILGIVWYFLSPLLTVGVYTLVFSEIFGMRWGQSSTSLGFGINVFAGLLVHGFFAEALQRSCQSIIQQPSLVKKVAFPLAVLPMVVTLSSLVHTLFGFVVVVALQVLVFESGPSFSSFLLSMVAMVVLGLGLAWAVAAVTVYLRDLVQIVALGLSLLMFLAPVFYPFSQVPEGLKLLVLLNPITVPVESVRAALLGAPPVPLVWLSSYCTVAMTVAVGGYCFFRLMSRGFSDVV